MILQLVWIQVGIYAITFFIQAYGNFIIKTVQVYLFISLHYRQNPMNKI